MAAHYLFIESQDPLEDRGAEEYLGYALALAKKREKVTVYFVENGALATRRGAQVPLRDALKEAGVTLAVDGFALAERGVGPERLTPGIQVGGVEQIVDLLANPETKAIWH